MNYELCTKKDYALLPHNSPLFYLSTFLHFHIFTFPLLYIITFMNNNINMCVILPFYDHVHINMVIKIAFGVHIFTYKIKENNMFRQKHRKINR